MIYNVAIPDVLITGGGVSGVSPRIRVDAAQTGFFAGREFRTFKELSIAASGSYVIRVIAAANTIGGESGDERGVAPATFYLRFTNLSASDPITGVFRLRWEERP